MSHLCGSGVHHGRGEDSNNSVSWVQNALLEDSGVLLHPPFQRHVIIFGPASQRVQQEYRVLVASLEQTALSVLHQEGVSIVDRVTQLECEYGICGE